ncbi:MAG: hypothetical protein CMD53_03225 [Gammaproteobacteria bacterium]|nr:hypothetical protein [Gammaproteobacteria bacterium]HJL96055.1 hypothetical protein [SAR86 cluster bacterium]|tara:strand:- start:5509 stop:5706 length:198 start_codon:yes stop_codon:yes gene_type:complete
MPEKKFQELEIEVKQLIKISQQLKDVNEDLFQKNSSLLEENKNLSKSLGVAKNGISKIINKYKTD